MVTKVKLVADGVITPDQITLTTASTGTNTTAPATTAFVQQEITALVDSSPAALNTLNELAAALGDDPNFATTVNTNIATKLPLAGGTLTGSLAITTASTADTVTLTRGTTGHNNMLKFKTGSSDKWIVGQRNDNTDHFRFYSYGTSNDVVSILTNGNVGIGTDNPGFPLHVNSSSTDVAKFQTSGAYTYTRFQNSSKTWALSIGSDFGFYDEAASATRMIIDSSGNVGIGESSPSVPLHIKDSGTYIAGVESTSAFAYLGLRDSNSGGSMSDPTVGVGVQTNDLVFRAGGAERMRIDASGNMIMTAGGTIRAGGVNDLILDAGESGTPDIFLQSGGSTKVKIEGSNGNVGIGTTSPDADLHIAGTNDNNLIIQNTTYQASNQDTEAAIRFKVTASADDERAKAGIHFKNDGSEYGRGDLYFTVDSNNDNGNVDINDSKMIITHEGNVGIGTNSPVTLKSSTTLQVRGNAKLGDDNARGLLSLGDIASPGANVGIWRGAAGAYAGTGNYLNLGGYSGITFTTGAVEIASQTERMRITDTGSVAINGPAVAGHSFEVQDKSDGYSMFWTGRGSSGVGRGLTASYGLMGVNSTQYDGDGSAYPIAGIGAAADNSSHESVDFWFGSMTSEWQPMVIYVIGASTQNVLTGQSAGWACIRATHYNNGISVAIVDSGGGGTFTVSVQGTYGADRAGTARVRVTYEISGNNRTVISAWVANYSGLYGAQRA